MFSVMVEELNRGERPETGSLEKRFDAAITKKLAVVKLPPAFWTQDPKINPRADLLFWAALIIGDRQRVDLAISVIAAELEEHSGDKQKDLQKELVATTQGLTEGLLNTINDTVFRQEIEHRTHELFNEFFQVTQG